VPQTWRPSFYRTATDAEIDLVLERPGKAGPVAVEFKYSAAPQVEKGFWTGLEDIKAARAFVVAPVKDAYPLKANVWVIPVHALERLTV